MNLILESPAAVACITNVGLILAAAGIEVRDFDWYVSDVETNIPVSALVGDGHWLTGDELAQVLATERLQFNWGVFSALPKGLRPDVEWEPFADGNGAYWQSGEVSPQLPGALFEITCWDSSAAILVGVTAEQAQAFLATFPDAKPLSEAR